MTCPTLKELRYWLADRLSENESLAIEAHVGGCREVCQAALDEMSGFYCPDDTEPGSWLNLPPLVESLTLDDCLPAGVATSAPRPEETRLAAAADLPTIGHYRLLARLGRGGMGTVYKALHVKLEKVVALKLLPADLMQNTQAVARFRREMRAVGRLNHPNIVIAHDADDTDGAPYLVMEFVDGLDFSTIVKRHGPLPATVACEMIRQAAIGLEHAHLHGLVHRDIKPSNLMLSFAQGDARASVKILDLGLALLDEPAGVEASQMTTSNAIMGTLDYMAPEQASDTHTVNGRADVYGLGATLFKLLTGHAPFASRMYKTSFSRLTALVESTPPNVARLRPDLPAELAAVVGKMMAKNPRDRYATPREAAEALAPFASGDDLDAFYRSLIAPAENRPKDRRYQRPGSETVAAQLRQPTVTELTMTQDWHPERELPPASSVVAQRRRRPMMAAVAFVGTALIVASVISLSLRGRAGVGDVASPQDPAPPQTAAASDAEVEISARAPSTHAAAAAAQPKVKLLVPAYFYPAADGLRDWNRLIAAASALDLIAIANPESGPGQKADAEYRKVIRRANEAGLKIIGYVPTHWGKRPAAEVKTDIDRWLDLYPEIQGFFIDEQASDRDEVNHYAALYAYAKQKLRDGLVVGNPGASCDHGYFEWTAADAICLADNRARDADFDRAARLPPSARGRLAVVIYNVADAREMRSRLKQAIDGNVNFLYFTDDGGDNPWDRLPTFWDEEVAALQQIAEARNRKSATQNPK